MKFLILISTFFFTIVSGAQNIDPAALEKLKVLACKSTSQEIPTGIITLTEGKHMTEFKVDQQVVWKVNLEKEDSTVNVVNLKDMNVKSFPLIQHMVDLAKPKKNIKIEAIKLSMVASKTDHAETLPERIERISDDAAGYIYLEALNTKNKTVGNSVMASWAGFFKDCQ